MSKITNYSQSLLLFKNKPKLFDGLIHASKISKTASTVSTTRHQKKFLYGVLHSLKKISQKDSKQETKSKIKKSPYIPSILLPKIGLFFKHQIAKQQSELLKDQITTLGAFFPSSKTEVTADSKKKTVTFLDDLIGNSSYNRQLSSFKKKQKLGHTDFSKISSDPIDFAHSFSFRTRIITQDSTIYDQVLKKLNKINFENAISDYSPNPGDRFTLYEMGMIRDFATIYDEISSKENLKEIFEDPKNQNLHTIFKNAEKCHKLMTLLKDKHEEAIKENKKGLIHLDNTIKSSKMKRNYINFLTKLISTHITKYDHAGIIINSDKNQLTKISHIFGYRDVEDLDMKRRLCSDFYEISLPEVPEAYHSKLKEKFGENWKDSLNAKFKVYLEKKVNFGPTRPWHSIGTIVQSPSKKTQFLSGLADFIPLGHSKIIPNDYSSDKLYKKIDPDENEKPREVLCSEFCAIGIIEAIKDFNKELKEELGITEDLIKIPFSKHENLHKLHPERLLKKLQKAGFTSEKPFIPPIISQFVDMDA